MKKIIFFDIDGTLLDLNKELPKSTVEGIRLARENGHIIAIATGRSPYMFEKLREELKIDTYVSLNGQIMVLNNEIVNKFPMDKVELAELVTFAERNNHSLVFLDEKQMISSRLEDNRVEVAIGSLKFPYPEFVKDFYLEKDVFQTLVFARKEEESCYLNQFKNYHMMRWHEEAFDVIPTGASKARGIMDLVDRLGMDIKDTVAFGDGLNDIEMLKTVDIGVCMGNGVKEAKLAADYITTSVDDNGIYNGLKKLGLI